MENGPKFRPDPSKKLMAQTKEVLRYHHYALRTEQTYCQWIRRYLRFHGGQTHPRDLDHRAVEQFLSALASEQHVSASTQRQALNAIVFLYRHVLDLPLDGKIEPERARRGRRPPTVLTQGEVMRLFRHLSGTHLLMAQLLYGCGLRLMECVRLRVQDVDFGQGRVFVRGGKGGKDRTVILPAAVQTVMEEQVERVQVLHENDLAAGFGEVHLPGALARKYPRAARELGWQYVFPAKGRSIDPRSGREGRHHVMESGLQKAVKRAAHAAGIRKRVGCHTFRHSYATHLLENNTNIRVVQELMGHADVKTTEIYTHVMQKDLSGIQSPLDALSPAAGVRVVVRDR